MIIGTKVNFYNYVGLYAVTVWVSEKSHSVIIDLD